MTRTTTTETSVDAVPERSPAAAVRAAVHALFARLGAAGSAEVAAERAHLLDSIAPLPLAERQRRAADESRRAKAEAIYRTVEGGGPAALTLAFDVFTNHIDSLERQMERQAEALKAIQLYAPDPWVRRIAQQALLDGSTPLQLPSFLAEPEDDRIPLEAYRFIG